MEPPPYIPAGEPAKEDEAAGSEQLRQKQHLYTWSGVSGRSEASDDESRMVKRDMSSVPRERLYERLARRFYAGVYNYLRWLSRDADLAKDLTQETFVQVWRHVAELRREQAAEAWIYRVARNEYLQHRRRSGLETVSLDDCAEADLAGWTGLDSHMQLERQWVCQAVRSAAESLPTAYREVIALHSLEGLSISRVAQVLGIPEGTVKSRLSKAFALLRHKLAAEVKYDEMQRG